MAYCTKCGADMGTMDTACPACGHNFSQGSAADVKTGWEYSGFAEIALFVAAYAALLGSIAWFVGSVVGIFTGQFREGLSGLVGGMVLLGVSVALLRSRNAK